MSTEEKKTNVLGQFVDGAQIIVGMKDKAFESFTERLGAVTAIAVPTIVLNDRFRIKPALRALPEAQRAQVVDNVIGGSITIGK